MTAWLATDVHAPAGSLYLMSGDVAGARLASVWSSRVNFVQVHFVREAVGDPCDCDDCSALAAAYPDCEITHGEA